MLIVKGVNVYPAAIKAVVNQFAPDVTGEMRVVLNMPPPRVVPPLRLKLEHGTDVGAEQQAGLARAIRDALHTQLKVSPEIAFVAPGSLEKSTRKTPLIEKNY